MALKEITKSNGKLKTANKASGTTARPTASKVATSGPSVSEKLALKKMRDKRVADLKAIGRG